ncbi:MAG: DNA repair protein RecO [Ruminococcaceae bacterium]|nr:DNA repair protein RecO [Oscillospiraceae bacterium]
MEPLKTTGIVIRTSHGKNSSLALSVLSPDMGKISVWARGARSHKNPMHSACTLLSYGEFILLPRGEMYSLTAASPIRSFYHLREDVEKLSFAVYFAELAGLVSGEGTEAEEAVRLLLNTLHYLEQDLKEPTDLKVMYELRLMCAAGFMPHTENCMLCGDEDAAVFSPAEGGLLCTDCSHLHPLSPGALSLLCGYVNKGLKASLDATGGAAADELATSVEQFVRHHTELVPRSLEYLHKIRNISVNE